MNKTSALITTAALFHEAAVGEEDAPGGETGEGAFAVAPVVSGRNEFVYEMHKNE